MHESRVSLKRTRLNPRRRVFPVSAELGFLLLLVARSNAAMAEPLEKTFGPDFEKGYRAEREVQIPRRGFKNRDRANFLGGKPRRDNEQPTRPDIQQYPSRPLRK